METLIYIYFGINLLILGSYLIDPFNNDTKFQKVHLSFFLLLFATILVVYEFTIADKVREWWSSSNIAFWYKLNITKDFDNKSKNFCNYLRKHISDGKGTKKDVSRLNRILKRNENR